ncbi:MAG TPA: cytochrome C [Candidatus Bathyarchaeia archaeon]|nr:cytochrome C [Candidatus Bathyarchaeia archaeon]
MRATRSLPVFALLVLLAAACSPQLPDADSTGAHLYVERCGVCHRVYAPGVLTAEMWKVQVARMQEMMERRGVRPLDTREQETILSYLTTHSG